ncbi:hypothetical protein LWI28_024155 [Acer negundo]|uniref:Uncharacterized protein n=1 Tax=Acer negundo TaxID=4023 RepID=A0AAD5NQ12_ACENE|nr:hypothetical protein LWI28_024155 [Acer negundo]
MSFPRGRPVWRRGRVLLRRGRPRLEKGIADLTNAIKDSYLSALRASEWSRAEFKGAAVQLPAAALRQLSGDHRRPVAIAYHRSPPFGSYRLPPITTTLSIRPPPPITTVNNDN